MASFGTELYQDRIQHYCFSKVKLIFRVVFKSKQVLSLQQSFSSLTNIALTPI